MQVLDGDFSDDNRRKCNDASRPLLQAVETLTTFASSPEFASVPAKISDKVVVNLDMNKCLRMRSVSCSEFELW